MKKALITLGFISALAAVIISVTKFSYLAVTPIAVAFITGIILIILSKNDSTKPKPIQYIFLLVIIALSFTIYKSVFIHTGEKEKTKIEQLNSENSSDSLKGIRRIKLKDSL